MTAKAALKDVEVVLRPAPVPMLRCVCGRPLIARKGTRSYPTRGTSLVFYALDGGGVGVRCVCVSCRQTREVPISSVVLPISERSSRDG